MSTIELKARDKINKTKPIKIYLEEKNEDIIKKTLSKNGIGVFFLPRKVNQDTEKEILTYLRENFKDYQFPIISSQINTEIGFYNPNYIGGLN